MAIRHLADHRDTIHSLISINGDTSCISDTLRSFLLCCVYCWLLFLSDDLFASGSHIGELIIWDSVDWTTQAYEHILWEEPPGDSQSEIRLKQIERSIQHMSSDGEVKTGLPLETINYISLYHNNQFLCFWKKFLLHTKAVYLIKIK